MFKNNVWPLNKYYNFHLKIIQGLKHHWIEDVSTCVEEMLNVLKGLRRGGDFSIVSFSHFPVVVNLGHAKIFSCK